jgi:hypothetical protein
MGHVRLATNFRNIGEALLGGSRSGRTGGYPTSEACASIVLRTTDFRRVGLKTGMKANAGMTFTLDGEPFPIGFVIDTVDEHFPFIDFVHSSRGRNPAVQRYRVRLLKTPQRLGGVRWWFVCPQTGRKAVKLYLPLGGHRFWSRQAYRLGYASQREDAKGRAQRQAEKIYRNLGGEGHWMDGAPDKPKWMRWRTYERKAEKLEHYCAKFDGAWAAGQYRFLDRYG